MRAYNVSFGSTTDLQRHAQLRPLSGVKQTFNVRFFGPNRFGASGCPLTGVKRTLYAGPQRVRY